MALAWNQRLIDLSADLHRLAAEAAAQAKQAETAGRRDTAFRQLGVSEGLATASELALAAAKGGR